MPVLETAALVALLGGYFDAKTRMSYDLRLGARMVGAGLNGAIDKWRDRLNGFYTFESWALSQPDATYLIYPEPVNGKVHKNLKNLDGLFNVKKYTWKQAYDIVLQYSDVLYNDYGVRPNDVVAVDFVNKDSFVFLWLALWNIGAVPALINYNLQGRSLIHCVETAKAKILLVDDEVAENGHEVESQLNSANVKVAYHDDAFRAKVSQAAGFRLPDSHRPVPNLWDPACYIYTSGTTGLPKAAVMSWKKASTGAKLYGAITFLNPKDVFYTSMPLYHSTAAVLGFLNCMHMGTTFAIGHKFSTTTFWTQVKLCDATVIQYVGETCRYLFNAPSTPEERTHRVRMACGNGIRPDIWAKFKERFNIPIINEFYGATEFPFVVTNHQEGNFGIGACGAYGDIATFLLTHAKVGIAAVDPEDPENLFRDPENNNLGRRALPDEPGEFVFKLNRNDIKADFQGYTGNQKATEEKIVYDLFKKGDCWMRSGDLLRMNKDNQIFFCDRMGDTFRWKSENVSTNEVEEFITHDPAIKQAVVVGVKVPQHEGRAGFAVIELNKGAQQPDGKQLAQRLLKELPRYAVPVFIKYVGEIETTGNNKIQKKKFRNQKLPSPEEQIYWLYNDAYVPLTEDNWFSIEKGRHKL